VHTFSLSPVISTVQSTNSHVPNNLLNYPKFIERERDSTINLSGIFIGQSCRCLIVGIVGELDEVNLFGVCIVVWKCEIASCKKLNCENNYCEKLLSD